MCPMRGRWDPVNEAIQQALAAITLADMREATMPLSLRFPAPANRITRPPSARPAIASLQSSRNSWPSTPKRSKPSSPSPARGYKWGFETDIEMDLAPKGLSEDTIRLISARKGEPDWLLAWRLKAYAAWLAMAGAELGAASSTRRSTTRTSITMPRRRTKPGPKSLDEVDPELLRTYEKLGIPLQRAGDPGRRRAGAGRRGAPTSRWTRCSTASRWRRRSARRLAEAGVIFCPISEAVREHPELVRKYLGSVVPAGDNFFAALNSAVFTDGSFVFIPKGVRCPMELSTYFRINARNTGQFERTLIIAEEGSYVSYLEGCTAPMRDENQLHAAVVELVALDDAQIKYSTVQNWYPGDAEGRGGIYNFVTKRGACRGARSKISWTQVETGSAITWKYPSCILQGDDSVGEFYSVAVTTNRQQADTGTKMIHIGKQHQQHDRLQGHQRRPLEQHLSRPGAASCRRRTGARNITQCDSLLIGDSCGAHTVPYIESRNPTAKVEHEATTSKIADDQLFYCRQRGLSEEDAVGLIVNGFCKEVLKELPMEFAVEAQKLLAVSLEGSVG